MRERVQSLGGSLSIESAPGAGTTVSVRLPVARLAAPQATDREANGASAPESRSGASSSRM
jgi:signal transduction histidine kinase